MQSFLGRKLWGFPRFAGDCASGHWKLHSGNTSEHKSDITDYCSQMILQLHDVYDPNKASIQNSRHLHCCDIVINIDVKHLVLLVLLFSSR